MIMKKKEKKQDVFGNISSKQELKSFRQSITNIKKETKLKKYKAEIEELEQKEKELTQKLETDLEGQEASEFSKRRGIIRGKLTRTKRKLEELTEESN